LQNHQANRLFYCDTYIHGAIHAFKLGLIPLTALANIAESALQELRDMAAKFRDQATYDMVCCQLATKPQQVLAEPLSTYDTLAPQLVAQHNAAVEDVNDLLTEYQGPGCPALVVHLQCLLVNSRD
jgi:hypothetical protein